MGAGIGRGNGGGVGVKVGFGVCCDLQWRLMMRDLDHGGWLTRGCIG